MPADLPSGRYVTPLRDGASGPPVLWVSDEPIAEAGRHWGRLCPGMCAQGLWPLVLAPLDGEEWAPWHDGELEPVPLQQVAARGAEQVLAELWHGIAEARYAADDDLDGVPGAWHDAVIELGLPASWPGLAPQLTAAVDPDMHAGNVAASMFAEGYLGVVPAARGADALAVLGWCGPAGHTTTADVAMVLRSWEERFGVRLLGLGFDTMELSVAAPPMSMDHARAVAAEHFAICPDNIAQGTEDFELYARHLRGAPTWSFWWD
jgi:hypothetical protein